MFGLFGKFTSAVRNYIDPLAEEKPEIEWVKWVDNPSLVAFTAGVTSNFRAAAKVASVSGKFIIKTKDGRFFRRYAQDDKEWQLLNPAKDCSGNMKAQKFRSAYLESVIRNAMDRGLRTQPSASEISRLTRDPGGMRMFIIWNGSDEDFKRLDQDYPSAPSGFNDLQVPADFAQTQPYFKAYLERRGYGPFWYDRGYDPVPESEKPPKTEVSDSSPISRSPFY